MHKLDIENFNTYRNKSLGKKKTSFEGIQFFTSSIRDFTFV